MDEGAEAGQAAARSEAHPLAEEAERIAMSLSGRLADAPAAEPENLSDNHTRAGASDEVTVRPPVAAREATASGAGATSAALPKAPSDAGKVRSDVGAAARGAGPHVGVRERAAGLGASMGESLKPKVERLREASSVVIDEATDDPGVRFLVIAAVLFLLFLLLWLLSFTLG